MTTGATETMVYLDRKRCGCVVGVTVDNPEHRTDVARFIADAVRRGGTVEHAKLETVREGLRLGCWHCDRCRAEMLAIAYYCGGNICRPCWFVQQETGAIPRTARATFRTRPAEVAV